MAANPQTSQQQKESMWENRIWTVTQTMMVGAMLWVGSTLLQMSNTVARIEERVSHAVTTQQLRDKIQDDHVDQLRKAVEEMNRNNQLRRQ